MRFGFRCEFCCHFLVFCMSFFLVFLHVVWWSFLPVTLSVYDNTIFSVLIKGSFVERFFFLSWLVWIATLPLDASPEVRLNCKYLWAPHQMLPILWLFCFLWDISNISFANIFLGNYNNINLGFSFLSFEKFVYECIEFTPITIRVVFLVCAIQKKLKKMLSKVVKF